MTVASGFTDNEEEILKRGSVRSMMTDGSMVVRQVEDDSDAGTQLDRIASGVSGMQSELRRGTQYDKIDEEELNRVNQELEDRENRGTSFRKVKKEDELYFEQQQEMAEQVEFNEERGSSVAIRKH